MVRNKNSLHSSSSQPLAATASISKHARLNEKQSTKELVKTESALEKPTSPSKYTSKKTSMPSSPSNAKLSHSGMNGAGEDSVNALSVSHKLLAGSSGAMVHFAQMNGCGRKDHTLALENMGESLVAKVFESSKEDLGDGYTSRMQAHSTNVYRKMFGRYKVGQQLLARWSDGLYYLGIICNVYDHKHQCEMKFEDESLFWVHFKDLHHINGAAENDGKSSKADDKDEDSESDVTCVLCRDGASDPPNEIVLCDKCGQGYHQECHTPHIDGNVLQDEEMPWQCRNCTFAACVRVGGAVKHGLGEIMKQMKCVFPYDINSLTWNKNHKINDEEKYCYCGGPGDWYLKMLQCARCNQWFHEACLQCLESPILYGDRYFVFVCSVCNHGNEFIKRLPMKWVDVVHLVLYNITIAKKVKYYDADAMISFFNKHLDSLRLTDEMAKDVSTRAELRRKVTETLQNKSRFQAGAEYKRIKPVWGLRNRSPPLPPTISLPAGIEVTEQTFSTLDLKHGSGPLSDSPTPLKKHGPCQIDGSLSPRSSRNAQITGRSPVKDLVKSGLLGDVSSSIDGLYGSSASMPPPTKRRRGRPKRCADSSVLPAGRLRRASSSSSLSSSKASWPSGPPGKKRKFSDASASSERNSKSGSSISKLWGTNSTGSNDAASSCSSGSNARSEDVKSIRDAVARYFGAEERVKSGEKFRVLGKRVTFAGPGAAPRHEYLIEWEGYTAGDLATMGKY